MWPFEGNHNADMSLGENEFDTPDVGELLNMNCLYFANGFRNTPKRKHS